MDEAIKRHAALWLVENSKDARVTLSYGHTEPGHSETEISMLAHPPRDASRPMSLSISAEVVPERVEASAAQLVADANLACASPQPRVPVPRLAAPREIRFGKLVRSGVPQVPRSTP